MRARVRLLNGRELELERESVGEMIDLLDRLPISEIRMYTFEKGEED
ncbi:MAG: hypothetical protein ACE5OO_01115 [Candidatus Bathyarchaeia archaeon]